MTRRRAMAGMLLVTLACRADDNRTVLELANWADYREADLERQVLAPFEQAHPGLVVQQQSAGTGQAEYRERILTSIVAGKPPDVFLLIEVADTTLDLDREKKLPAYARAGIQESWLVNLEEQSIEVYREPHPAGYQFSEILRPGAQARPVAFPDVAVDVADLLKIKS